jgi:hypothetical protein
VFLLKAHGFKALLTPSETAHRELDRSFSLVAGSALHNDPVRAPLLVPTVAEGAAHTDTAFDCFARSSSRNF